MMDENGEIYAEAGQGISASNAPEDNPRAATDEAIDMNNPQSNGTNTESYAAHPASNPFHNGEIRTLDGDIAGDEFAADAINYQVLLGKIDKLLEKLKLDA